MSKIILVGTIHLVFAALSWGQTITVEPKAGMSPPQTIQLGIQKCKGDGCAVFISPDVGAEDVKTLPNNVSLIDYRRFLAPLRVWNNPSTNERGQVAGVKVNVASADNLGNPSPGDFVAGYFYIDSLNNRNSIWALNPLVAVGAGHDARAEGIEVDVENSGSDVAEWSFPTQLKPHKSGIEIVKGSSPQLATGALRITTTSRTGTGWHKGIDIAGVVDVGLSIGTNAAVTGIATNPRVGISLGYGQVNTAQSVAIRARQFTDDGDTFVAQRHSEGSAGTLFRAIDARGKSLFFVDPNGMVRGVAFGSTTSGQAKNGTVRLAKDELICWRNEAGNGDVCLGKTNDDRIEVTKLADAR